MVATHQVNVRQALATGSALDTQTQVSVIIVTHNSLPIFQECLENLKESISSFLCDLIVADNGSTDGSFEAAKHLFPDVKTLLNKRNRGFAYACNLGAECAQGEFLLFLNPDVKIDPDAVQELLKACKQDDKVGLVSGRLRQADGSFNPSCRHFPTIRNLLFSRGSLLSSIRGSKIDTQSRYTLPDYDEITEVPAMAATMMMVRKSLFESLGGFDNRFFMYVEDTDLSFRVRQSGYRNLFIPTAGGVHLWGTGSKAGSFRRRWLHHISMWKYFLKHEPNGFSVFVAPLLLSFNLLVSTLLASARPGDAR